MTRGDNITESLESLEVLCPSKVGIFQAGVDLSRREPGRDPGSIHLEAHIVPEWGARELHRIWNNRRQRDGHTERSDDSFDRTSSIDH